MRVNLKINFGKIEELADKSTQYASSLSELHEALNTFKAVVDSNKGLTAEELKTRPADLSTQINKLASGLELMSGVLKEFDSAMTGIIKPTSDGADMIIETWAAKRELKSLGTALETLKSSASGKSLPQISNSMPDKASADADAAQEIANAQANYEEAQQIKLKVEQIFETYQQVTSSLADTYIDVLNDLYTKVENFENTDDDFENKGESIYEDWQDLKWHQTTTGKLVFAAIGIAVCIAAICIAAPIVAGAAAAGTTATVAAGVVTVAKGALCAAAATSGIQTGLAIYNKEDIDSAAGEGLCEGLIVGGVSAGIGVAAPYITQVGSKVFGKTVQVASQYAPNATAKAVQYGSKMASATTKTVSKTANKYAPKLTKKILDNKAMLSEHGVKVLGEVSGDKVASMYLGKEYEVVKSTGKAVAEETVDIVIEKKTKGLSKLIDDSNIIGTMQKKMKTGLEAGMNVIGEEIKQASTDTIDSIDTAFAVEQEDDKGFKYDTTFDEPVKLVENALAASKKDPKELIKTGTEKVIDYFQDSLVRRTGRV
ncbi:MAG: hypothetical protein E7262_01270 [Lachnospiraceae bacterium]|nr:hypothetical protein [Lachnospiraceae bacterium]